MSDPFEHLLNSEAMNPVLFWYSILMQLSEEVEEKILKHLVHAQLFGQVIRGQLEYNCQETQ